MGRGVYASVEELNRLEPRDPLVILDNTSAVAEDLWEQGWQFSASWALQDNIALARTLPDRRHLATALRDAVSILLRGDSYQDSISQYACELASMVGDPGEASELWAMAGRAFMARGKPIQAEQAINRAMSTGRPHPLALLARAEHLVVSGLREEACAAYRKVVKACAAATGPEYGDMAEEARWRLRKLEGQIRAAKRKQ
jgi:tetratricopeptide (TPR) repeat protein